MTGWLEPLRAALDARPEPVCFFFRDDDAGWDDAALEALLDVFEPHGLPLDVAVIPLAATPRTVQVISARQTGGRNDLLVHQHGLAHVNHEPLGRKCEFGVSRSRDQQRDDIARGRDVLREMFGDVPAIFTPPWNRCAPWTADVLRDLGFAVLSRDVSAGRAGVPGLAEQPISVDWFGRRRKQPLDRRARGEVLAEMAAGPGPLGLMLHHQVMSVQDRADVDELLALVDAHPGAAAAHLDRPVASSASRWPGPSM